MNGNHGPACLADLVHKVTLPPLHLLRLLLYTIRLPGGGRTRNKMATRAKEIAPAVPVCQLGHRRLSLPLYE
jgi:hypothetical protein